MATEFRILGELEVVQDGKPCGLGSLRHHYDAQKCTMTGTVVEGFGEYSDLGGADVAMSGTFTVDDESNPLTAPGTIEIG